MSVKILGGEAKGFSLKVFESDNLRPTSVLLRRKIFDSISFYSLAEYSFFDLCAGTGAMGLEAISRGFQRAYFFEPERKIFNGLKQNIDRFSDKYARYILDNKIVLDAYHASYESSVNKVKDLYLHYCHDENTILFFDPPYENYGLYRFFLESILKKKWFHGKVWLEMKESNNILDEESYYPYLTLLKTYRHGEKVMAVFSCNN